MDILKILFLIHSLCVVLAIDKRSFNYEYEVTGLKELKISSPPNGQIYLRVYSSCAMAIPFEFGTPAQHFNLSFNFLMPDTTLYLDNIPYEQPSKADPPVYNRNIFSPNKSSTFLNLSTTSFSDYFYGRGYLAQDYVNNPHIWKKSKSGMDFMLITKAGIPGIVLSFVPVDGFLGLAPGKLTSVGIPSFMNWLTHQSSDNSSSITFYLNKFNSNDPEDMKKSSFAVVDFSGNALPSFCVAKKWFHSKIPILDWSLMAKGITMETSSGGNSSIRILSENQVIKIEPTTFLTRIPKKQMDVLKEIVGATKFFLIYQLPCNSTKTAPTIKFLFVNSNVGQQQKMIVKFDPDEYIIPSEFGDCQLIFTLNPNPKGREYLLGYSFFHKHCLQLKYNVHVEKDEAIVGITPKKSSLYDVVF